MHAIKRIRPLLIALGVVAIAAEIGLNGYGVWIGETDPWLRAVILSVAASLPIGEAAMMLRAGQIEVGTKRGDLKWAYGLWFVCLLGGLFMTLNGASVREDRKESTRVAGFLKTSTNEKTEAEAKADRDTLAANIKQIESAPNTNVTTPRNGPRSVDELSTDGRFIKTLKCTDDEAKRNPGQRNVCAEYHLRRGVDKMHADLKALDDKLDKVRASFTSGEPITTTREMPMYRRLREWGADPSFLQALIMTLVLHGFASFVWHTIPGRDDDETAGAVPVAPSDRYQPVFHIHTAQPVAAAQPSLLSLPSNQRHYDPQKQFALLMKFWGDTLPTITKERHRVDSYLAAFNAICDQEHIERPERMDFCKDSAKVLPNCMPIGGEYFFTPS